MIKQIITQKFNFYTKGVVSMMRFKNPIAETTHCHEILHLGLKFSNTIFFKNYECYPKNLLIKTIPDQIYLTQNNF